MPRIKEIIRLWVKTPSAYLKWWDWVNTGQWRSSTDDGWSKRSWCHDIDNLILKTWVSHVSCKRRPSESVPKFTLEESGWSRTLDNRTWWPVRSLRLHSRHWINEATWRHSNTLWLKQMVELVKDPAYPSDDGEDTSSRLKRLWRFFWRSGYERRRQILWETAHNITPRRWMNWTKQKHGIRFKTGQIGQGKWTARDVPGGAPWLEVKLNPVFPGVPQRFKRILESFLPPAVPLDYQRIKKTIVRSYS